MKTPPHIMFRHMDPSPALEADILEKLEKLNSLYDRITGCHVAVEVPHLRHHQGKRFHVRIQLAVPGEDIIVCRDPEKDGAHEDPYVAVHDAFDAARRQLQDYLRRRRGETKQHRLPASL